MQDRRGQVMSFADESASSFNQVYDESQESTGAGAYRKYLLEYLTEYYFDYRKTSGLQSAVHGQQ